MTGILNAGTAELSALVTSPAATFVTQATTSFVTPVKTGVHL